MKSGINNILGISNTFIGNQAGYSSVGTNSVSPPQGHWNTFTGHRAGYSNTTGIANCFYGKEAGFSTIDGKGNSFFGNHAGHGSLNTIRNTFIGTESGYYVQGDSNAIVGSLAGYYFNEGNRNTFIGFNAQNFGNTSSYSNNISNATAIGANAIVPDNNQMILGDNNVNIGIGLSGDNSASNGPQNKLEINADPNSMSYTGVGGSGLRFRQLTSSATPGANPGSGVLAVRCQWRCDICRC
jgi:trimeric autotransporter adhesin